MQPDRLFNLTRLPLRVRTGSRRTRRFVIERQQRSKWCWAACAVSIGKFYNPGSRWTQSRLALNELGQTTDCRSGASVPCNRPWYLHLALQTIGTYAGYESGKLSMDALKAEIDAERPLGVCIEYSGDRGHAVVIYGYGDSGRGDRYINVGDPLHLGSVQKYASFPGAYHGDGSWAGSYFTRHG